MPQAWAIARQLRDVGDDGPTDFRAMDAAELRDCFQRHAIRLLLSPPALVRMHQDLIEGDAKVRLAMMELLLRHIFPLQSVSTSRKLVVHSQLARPPADPPGTGPQTQTIGGAP